MSDERNEQSSEARPVWMVVRDGPNGPVTFGPFTDRREAERFTNSQYGGHVYDGVQDRRSNCGPWLP